MTSSLLNFFNSLFLGFIIVVLPISILLIYVSYKDRVIRN
nr:photosystem II protein X [Galdieria sp.]WDA99616.1 photosystem II protein X [Galdieria sulphuraria]